MSGQPGDSTDYERQITELRDLVLNLWSYAQLQGIERHAEDGDHYASALVSLVRTEIASWRTLIDRDAV